MRAIGIIRRIDELGRVVIPKELLRTMHIRGRPVVDFIDSVGDLFLTLMNLEQRAGLQVIHIDG